MSPNRAEIEDQFPGLQLGHDDPETGERRYSLDDVRKVELSRWYGGTRLEPYIESHFEYFSTIRDLRRGWGHYEPHYDPALDVPYGAGGTYENRPSQFKLHLNPTESEVCLLAFSLIDLSRQSPEFRDALHEMMFALRKSDNEAMPEIVLFPRDGSLENTEALMTAILAHTGDRFQPGPHRPRHSLEVSPLCYLAQGSGDTKDEMEEFRQQYDARTGHAILPEDVPAVTAMLERVTPLSRPDA